ncbi:MAG: hypothetical protein RL264_2036 [Bacteroidota bacterium]|jgi:hypothetical protein
MNKKSAILIAVFSFFVSFFWNEINVRWGDKSTLQLREGQTIYTEDDISYLRQAELTEESTNFEKVAATIRPPGYGLWYKCHLILYGENALIALKISQLLLFSTSVFAIYFLFFHFTASNRLATFGSLVFGMHPMFFGFLYYTLTEGITPYIFLIALGIFINGIAENRKVVLLISALLFGFLLLVRPALVVIIPFLTWYYLKNTVEELAFRMKWVSVYALILAFPLLIWQLNFRKERGYFGGLHPIYQNELPGVFRPVHASVWNLFRGWESSSENFHETIAPFWEASLSGQDLEDARLKFFNAIAPKVRGNLNENKLKKAILLYQLTIIEQAEAFHNHELLPKKLSKNETNAINLFEELAIDFMKQDPITYHLKTPLKVAKSLVVHSNLSMNIFQHTFRGNLLMELFRFVSLGLHVLLFVLGLVAVFTLFKSRIYPFVVMLNLYFFYLIYVQRGIEERYTLPFLGILLLIGILQFSNFRRNKFMIIN